MSGGRAALEAMFRDAAAALDPATGARARTAAEVRALLTVHAVRGQRRWLDAALAGLEAAAATEPWRAATGGAADWLDAACRGWVQRADRSLRTLAERLVGELEDDVATVPARLLYWRTTGLRWVLDGALALAPAEVAPGDAVAAAAAWAAYGATARDELAAAARVGFGGGLADVTPSSWPAAVAALDLEPEDVDADAIEAVGEASPGDRLVAAAALVAPIIRLDVEWHVASELREGPMAEAATYPWPALRITFRPMEDRDQLRFHPSLAGEPLEMIEDVGVIAAALEHIVGESDRSALLEGMGRRRGRSLLRRR